MASYSYGDYSYLCSHIPSLALCNLFVRQFLDRGASDQSVFGANFTRKTAGVGFRATCQIPSAHDSGSVGNVANIVLCAVSALVAFGLAWRAFIRWAAVGKGETTVFYVFYGITCLFQLLTSGAFLNQGSAALVWLTAVHIGLIVALFWMLLWLALLTLQFVEDGRKPSFSLMLVPAVVLFGASTYIALDVAFQETDYFRTSIDRLHSAWLFSLTTLWPAVAIAAFLGINIFVTVRILKERKPIFLFFSTLLVFALAEGARYALSHRICTGTNSKVDGSFLGTLLETAAVALHFLAWRSITESQWDDSASVAFL